MRSARSAPPRVRWLVAGAIAAAAIALAVGTLIVAREGTPPDPMQQILDGVTSGPDRLAPGATAYVVGPHGTWHGSAGVADIRTRAPMPAHARMRIESNSKLWLVAVVLQLVRERRLSLDDTVDRWLPGLLRAHGDDITLRQLMSDSSGLIDDNDVFSSLQAPAVYLARVRDRRLRAGLRDVAARLRADPTARVSPVWFIRLAAWQPLVAPPGTTYHHSNIGWNVAGMIAAEASGTSLGRLYAERIFRPLGLRRTAYDPQGPIAGPHARGYAVAGDGALTDMTARHLAKGADGAIVTDAADEGRFLAALADGRLLTASERADLGTGEPSGCGGPRVRSNGGAGDGFRSHVVSAVDGTRVAVLLLNGSAPGERADARVATAAKALYCAGG